jgi:hypothetical protein
MILEIQEGTGCTDGCIKRDLLQIGPDDGEGPAVLRVELGSDAKECMNESALSDHIALRQPPDLPFPDQMHRFVTIYREVLQL